MAAVHGCRHVAAARAAGGVSPDPLAVRAVERRRVRTRRGDVYARVVERGRGGPVDDVGAPHVGAIRFAPGVDLAVGDGVDVASARHGIPGPLLQGHVPALSAGRGIERGEDSRLGGEQRAAVVRHRAGVGRRLPERLAGRLVVGRRAVGDDEHAPVGGQQLVAAAIGLDDADPPDRRERRDERRVGERVRMRGVDAVGDGADALRHRTGRRRRGGRLRLRIARRRIGVAGRRVRIRRRRLREDRRQHLGADGRGGRQHGQQRRDPQAPLHGEGD